MAPVAVPGFAGITSSSSGYFAFTPHGTQFAKPVSVKIPYTGNGAYLLRLDNENDPTWEIVTGVSFAGGVASFDTNRFSILTVVPCQSFTCAGAPASLECGAVDDGCGGTFDMQGDCGRAACAAGQTCARDNTCCTPYATCADALTAAKASCGPAVPDGCGGTMNCSNVCSAPETCLQASGGYYSCFLPCATNSDCPASGNKCIDQNTWSFASWSCVSGSYCMGGGTAPTTCPSGTTCSGGTCQ